MDLSNLVALAAIEAGERILDIYKEKLVIEYKEDESPLTVADRRAHEVITNHLNKTPYKILSEEGRDIPYNERKSWPKYWLVDPLDGTKEFIKKNGEFTVNIALISNGIPVFGVVYAPVKQWLYIGVEGEGAWKVNLENHQLPADWQSDKNQLPLYPSDKKCFTIVGSRSHASADTDKFIAQLEEEHGTLSFISMGSSLKLCLVAEGKADLYPRLAPTMEWDTAAGDAVARNSGCKVVQYETGEALQYNKENLLNPWFVVKR